MITLAFGPSASRAANSNELDLHAMIQPSPLTARFSSPEFDIWGASPIQGDDGKYHIFYSRWPHKLTHKAWVTHSEIAHAVSDSPFGPWEHHDVALPARGGDFWDGACTHNPNIKKIKGKYYLYYMGNKGDGVVVDPLNFTHRNNQRIGVAVAESPNGPWQRFDRPIIDVSENPDAADALCVSNPSAAVRPDGGVLLIYKAVASKRPLPSGGPVTHMAATSDSPTGPFTKHPGEIFTSDDDPFPAEDPFVWYGEDRYWAVVKDRNGRFTGITPGFSLALFESADGFAWKPAAHALVSSTEITWADGTTQKLAALERPQLLFEDGRPVALFCAAGVKRDKENGFNVQIPLRLSEPK